MERPWCNSLGYRRTPRRQTFAGAATKLGTTAEHDAGNAKKETPGAVPRPSIHA